MLRKIARPLAVAFIILIGSAGLAELLVRAAEHDHEQRTAQGAQAHAEVADLLHDDWRECMAQFDAEACGPAPR